MICLSTEDEASAIRNLTYINITSRELIEYRDGVTNDSKVCNQHLSHPYSSQGNSSFPPISFSSRHIFFFPPIFLLPASSVLRRTACTLYRTTYRSLPLDSLSLPPKADRHRHRHIIPPLQHQPTPHTTRRNKTKTRGAG